MVTITMDGKILLERIKTLCMRKGISIRQLEKETGLTVRTVGRWDTNMPSVDRVKKVADYFHVPVDYLLGDDSYSADIDADAELNDYLEMIRTNPAIRNLLKTQRGATRKEVEDNVAFLQTLKVFKERGGYV